jgi:1-acyl-sn-glycerol-3-phosphate acyltransferase
MRFLRSLLFLLGQIVTAVPYSLVAIAAFPLPSVPRSRLISGWAHFVMWWLKITCGITHSVQGLEHLPTDPCVILSKHQSAWETIAFQVIFPPQTWVLKRELLWIPLFGWALAASRPIAIDRGIGAKALDKVAKQGVERIHGGRYVIVFPEGTRVRAGDKGRYNPGGAMLAVKADVPVVPVAHNAGEFWPRRGFLKRPGVIQVVVGPQIDASGRRARQITAQAEAWIETTMKDITG